MEQVREGAMHRLDQQKTAAATGLTSLVGALRQSGRQLEGENATVASYVDAAAGQVERFVDGLRDRDLSRMMTDLEGFARRRPAVFLGSAFVLGVAAARFLKSAPPEVTAYAPPVGTGELGTSGGGRGGGYGENR